MNSIIILGSTGSIGTQALDVIDKLNIKVSVLTARKNITLLEKQIRKYKPEIAVVTQEKYALQLRENIKDTNCKVICGKDSLCQAASYENGDIKCFSWNCRFTSDYGCYQCWKSYSFS